MKSIIFYLFMMVIIVSAEMYIRIPPFKVNERVQQFLEYHDIDNCFERLIGENELQLKCLRHNALVNVLIAINEEIYI